jgi:endonuclease YncB( thermonuclease family)
VWYTVFMTPMPLRIATFLGLASLLSAPVFAADPPKVASAKVTKVNDGDSIEVQLEAGPGRVRFSAIDTPEYDQPYGSQSSAAL